MKKTSFKDLLANTNTEPEQGTDKVLEEPLPRRSAGGEAVTRGGASLLDRLAAIGGSPAVASSGSKDTASPPAEKRSKRRFRIFGSKQN
jgi:hypothetical protein